MATRRRSTGRRRQRFRRAPVLGPQRPLFVATDHGRSVTIPADQFGRRTREGGWGASAEPFLRMNEKGLSLLDVRPELAASAGEPVIRLSPGGHTGAIPLRSAITGHVVGGFIVKPRFGWSGVGQVLSEIGWHAAPQFVDLPLVPGSGREIPPWVLAGPILARIARLLARLSRGYVETESTLTQPRGRILWNRYIRSMARGVWHQLPCRYPDLASDLTLRRLARWALERVRRELLTVGGTDPIALVLASLALRLLDDLADVQPLMPRRDELARRLGDGVLMDDPIRRGIEAMAWIVDERGLGGGREQDGLAWHLSLSELWESFVESHLRHQAALTGADLHVGRLGESTFPVRWSTSGLRALGHLVPDFVLRHRRSVQVVDAKYKSHMAELDEAGWRRMADDARESHRADFHQILAYSALFDADEVTATLVYPLRRGTYEALRARGRDVARAALTHGGRRVTAELQGIPFGAAQGVDGSLWPR